MVLNFFVLGFDYLATLLEYALKNAFVNIKLHFGRDNSNSFSNNILALHTCRITFDVRGTDFIGYSVLYDRLSLS